MLHIVAMHLSRTELSRLRSPDHLLLPRRLAYGVGSSAEHQIPAVASLLQLSVYLMTLKSREPVLHPLVIDVVAPGDLT